MYFDIETTSLQADAGILVSAGFIYSDGETDVLFVDKPDDEKKIIQQALERLKKEEFVFIWYTGFDIPFLIARAIKNGLDISEIYSIKFVDLCDFTRQNLKLASAKLDEVSKFLNIEKEFSLTGKSVQNLYFKAMQGDKKAKEEIVGHCIDDLKALKSVHEKVKPYVNRWLQNKNLKKF